jgi:broad specificity phosphatase PhoE
LTDKGRSQAQTLAQRLTHVGFDRIISSDLRRAAETARIISAALSGPTPIHDARLRERSAVWSGLISADIEVSFPGQLEAWRNGELRELPTGSELWDSFLARISNCIEEHVRGGCTVLAVAHAGVFRAVEASFQVPFRRVGNLDGQWLQLDPDSITPGPLL